MVSEDGRAAAQRRYRGLLLDWGGVMTTDLFASFRAFCEQAGLEPDTIRRRFREDRESRDLLIALETGKLSEEEFEPKFAAKLGIDGVGLIDRLFAGSSVDEQMVGAVAAARGFGIHTGLISNSWGTRRYPRDVLTRLFEGIVISGEVGLRKPAPEIYEMGAEAIGLPPSDCVFVDDLPFNLEPATALGMATVHHVTPDQTIPQLEQLLGVELSS
ncbi:MAG: HAD family hydrolase [Solirubrobacteraceae bacterium]